jgi:hypothetical protein
MEIFLNLKVKMFEQVEHNQSQLKVSRQIVKSMSKRLYYFQRGHSGQMEGKNCKTIDLRQKSLIIKILNSYFCYFKHFMLSF